MVVLPAGGFVLVQDLPGRHIPFPFVRQVDAGELGLCRDVVRLTVTEGVVLVRSRFVGFAGVGHVAASGKSC